MKTTTEKNEGGRARLREIFNSRKDVSRRGAAHVIGKSPSYLSNHIEYGLPPFIGEPEELALADYLDDDSFLSDSAREYRSKFYIDPAAMLKAKEVVQEVVRKRGGAANEAAILVAAVKVYNHCKKHKAEPNTAVADLILGREDFNGDKRRKRQ